MKQSKWMVAVACAGLAMAAPTGLYAADQPSAPIAPAHQWKHPEMHRALHSLRQANLALETAAHDFGGHRKNAMHLAEDAILQVEAGLKLDNDLPTPTTQPSVPGTKAEDKAEAQKQLREARRLLQQADTDLKSSAHDFDGHRAKALKLTADAIKEVEDGLAVNK